MAAGLQFGIKQLTVHFKLKSATIGGDKREMFDIGFIFIEKFFRQPDGARGVVSSGTIR